MSNTPRKTWIHDLEENGYDLAAPVMPHEPAARQGFYHLLYQATGEVFAFMPDPDTAFCDTLAPDGRPEAVTGEWHAYNAACHALLTAMDALAALVDITEQEGQ